MAPVVRRLGRAMKKIPLLLLICALNACYLAEDAMREVIVRPRGLVTSPNKYGQYPAGAMSTCRNVALRDPGVITSLPARRSFQADMMGNGYTSRRICSGASSVLSFGDNAGACQARWSTTGGNTPIDLTSP